MEPFAILGILAVVGLGQGLFLLGVGVAATLGLLKLKKKDAALPPAQIPSQTTQSRDVPQSKPEATSLAGAMERKASAAAVVAKPTQSGKPAPYNVQAQGQSLRDWLANIAYWAAYPQGPTKIDPKNTDHMAYAAAWIRIRGHVDRCLALQPYLGPNPLSSGSNAVNDANWQRWALALALSSSLREATALRDSFRLATAIAVGTKDGALAFAKLTGKPVLGVTATPEGLLGHLATLVAKHDYSKDPALAEFVASFPAEAGKAFLGTNGTWTAAAKVAA